MKVRRLWIFLAVFCMVRFSSPGASTNYVDSAGTNPVPPFSAWVTAARTLQDAVTVAQDGNVVLVTNGIYVVTNPVTVNRALAIRSLNGAAVTVVRGGYPASTNRCFHLLGSNIVIEGFTITNGHASGDWPAGGGGGVFAEGPGATVRNCRIAGNVAQSGGGVLFASNGEVADSEIAGNAAADWGGGVYIAECTGTLLRCSFARNSAGQGGGGASIEDGVGRFFNCAVVENEAPRGGGIDSEGDVILQQCTVSGNRATCEGGGLRLGWWSDTSLIQNSILYFNEAPVGPNYFGDWGGYSEETNLFAYSCTTPAPPGGPGNITQQPGLLARGNPHLVSNSICLHAGSNGYVSVALDLDGEARTNGPRVDIGCDEFWSGGITGALAVAIDAPFTNAVVNFPVEFRSVLSGRANRYEWQFGDGQKASNLCVAAHPYAATGRYTVVLTAWNNGGQAAATTVVSIVSGYTNYVALSGSHTPPFTNWAKAATTLQAAIDAAPCAGGLTLVAAGTYSNGGYTLHGRNRIAIYKPISVLATNMDPARTVIVGAGPLGSNAVRCVYVGAGARLAGFALSNGFTRSYGDVWRAAEGGGVYVDTGGQITNCFILQCAAASGGGGALVRPGGFLRNSRIAGCSAQDGGGVACDGGGWVEGCEVTGNYGSSGGGIHLGRGGTVTNCVIADNASAYSGGGVYSSVFDDDIGLLANCTIRRNSAGQNGGGVYLNGGGLLRQCLITANVATNGGNGWGGGAYANGGRLEDCQIAGNSARMGGGACVAGDGILTNCTIAGNASGSQGGGVFCFVGGLVTQCTIRDNYAANNGGGVDADRQCRIEDCDVSGNRAGGYGGGFVCYFTSTVVRCTITGNRATSGGGGVGCWYSGYSVSNCLIAGNTSDAEGGGLYTYNKGQIENCTIAGNQAAGSGGGAYGNLTGGALRNCVVYANTAGSGDNYAGNLTFRYCCTWGLPSGAGNLMDDPRFLDVGGGDYRLATNSPCIDRGTNVTGLAATVDLDGHPRILNGVVDIGAYESGPLYCSFRADPPQGFAPLAVQFTGVAGGTHAASLHWRWDFNGDAVPDVQGVDSNAPAWTYAAPGAFTVMLTVSNALGQTAWCVRTNYISARAADVCYVSTNGAQVYPFASWNQAARDIQAAVDAALPGGTVLVSNGVYETLLPITVNKALTLRGVGGASNTVVDGARGHRVFTVTAPALIDGFTITNGFSMARGGGVYCDGAGALSNCVISGNRVLDQFGGGAFLDHGGAIWNSVFTDNMAQGGGGVYFEYDGTVVQSLLAGNTALNGGGAFFNRGGALARCTLDGNTASSGSGGGVYGQSGGELDHCLVTSNSAAAGSGGGAYDATLRNCFLARNRASSGGGISSGAAYGCTIVGNASDNQGGGTYGVDIYNSIVFFNTTAGGLPDNFSGGSLEYSCTTPDSGGTGNVTNNPMIVGLYDPHLLTNSPCIDRGENSYAEGTDIDGEPRYGDGTVDMGCDEVVAAGLAGALQVEARASYTNAVVGFPIDFEAVIRGRVNRYAWNFCDGQQATNEWAVSHAFAATGTYPVLLSAWNNDTVATATVTVRIVTGYTNHVSLAGSHAPPFSTWATAATNIQAAIDANTVAGGFTLVAAGRYERGVTARRGMSHRMILAKAVTVVATNSDPVATEIVGVGPSGPDAMRCAYVGGGGRLVGFTLTNGFTRTSGDATWERSGGGLICDADGTVSNCAVRGCGAVINGGGAVCLAGGAIWNSVLRGNGATNYGGGVYLTAQALIARSTLSENVALLQGGGAYAWLGGTVQDCTVEGNRASNAGGGIHCQQGGLVQGCTVVSNTAGQYQYGGGVRCNSGGIVLNTLLHGNSAGYGGGYSCNGGGIVEGCTIAANQASQSGGGSYCSGSVFFRDTILYGNTAPSASNYTGGSYAYCGAAPAPAGEGNTGAPPLFLDEAGRDFRLAMNSLCVNAGTNLEWMAGARDLDGNARIAGGIVDIGAYEQGRLRASFSASPLKGLKPLAVDFLAAVSATNTSGIYYRWDMDHNGSYERQGPGSNAVSYTYATAGVYSVRLVVSNAAGEVYTAVRTNYLTVLATNMHYVSTNGADVYPYTAWATAARSVQSAVDAALESGGTVLVSNGVYALAGQIAIAKGLLVKSVNGLALTTINGSQAGRCFYLSHSNAVVDGFTITGGYASDGGGAYLSYGGLLQNCLIASNTAASSGGGAYLYRGGTVRNCTIAMNKANSYTGGGVAAQGSGLVEYCTIVSNTATTTRGGGVAVNGTGVVVRGCAILGNRAAIGGGISFEASGRVVNCTVAGNTASSSVGGINSVGTVQNTIVWYNTAPASPNHYGGTFSYSATTPDPGGTGNFTNAPGLLSLLNPHVVSNSPCLNTGTNVDLAGAWDIDGESRTNGPRVDIGCDEYVAAGITGALSVAIGADFTNAIAGWPITLQSSIQGKARAFEWQFGDGRKATNDFLVVHAYTNAGVFSVVLTAWNNTASAAATTTIRIVNGYTNCVSLAGGHVPPFTNWATAARDLQAAVDANVYAGGVTRVAPGTYDQGGSALSGMSNRVELVRPITLVASNSNPAATVIVGQGPSGDGAVRCAYVGSGARLSGFTLTNGFTRTSGDVNRERSAGGAFCEAGGLISNCLVTGCAAGSYGGGLFLNAGGIVQDSTLAGNVAGQNGGGAFGGGLLQGCRIVGNSANIGGGVHGVTVRDSELTRNSASQGGGASSSTLRDCVIGWNSATTYGGGANGGSVFNSLVCSNTSSYQGGGLYGANAENSRLLGNTAADSGGGSYIASGSSLQNCLVTRNSAGSYGGGTHGGTIRSCTLSGNTASYGGGLYQGAVQNSIIYFNTATSGTSSNYYLSGSCSYCCTAPLPGGSSNSAANPLFLDDAGGDFRLDTSSLCVNAGTNQAWMTNATDVAGNSRINGGTVDLGAYESGPLGCSFVADRTKAIRPATIHFTALASGTNTANLYYRWDFDGNGVVDAQGWNTNAPAHIYTNAGLYTVGLTASNASGESASCVKSNYLMILITNIHYVAHAGTHVFPFASWVMAATNLQDAVDAAIDGGLVLVTNGTYHPPAAVRVAKPVTVKSVNGAGATLVDGSRSHRVFTIAGDAILEGLTITNGHVAGNGGGVYLERGGGLVDCVIAGNDSSNFGGGGVYIDLTGTVTRCLISGNTAANQGGAGAYLAGGGAIRDSVITGNQLAVSGGGGVYLGGGGLVQNSMIRANTAPESGGVRCDSLGILENCLLIGNTASEGGGGGISLYYGGLVRNCTVSDNTSAGIDYSSGGIYCENGGAVINSILFFNNAEYPEHQEYGSGTSYSNCCTTPAVGENGVTNEPRLVNWAAGDYRLATNSPCVDAGVDEDWMPAALDFEGKPRVLGPHVDIGAYELIPPSWDADTDGLPDWWEWRYAHSMTGIVSGADADTDGFCNDGEYLAGTDPNDPGSYLGFVAIVMTGAPTGTVVRWQSVDGKYYRLERGTNLSFTMPFDFTVRTNIPGTAPMNTETDSTAVGRGPWFYRIKLE